MKISLSQQQQKKENKRKATLYMILGFIAIGTTVIKLWDPLCDLWLNQRWFDRVQEMLELVNLAGLVAVLIFVWFERKARISDNIERIEAEEAIEDNLKNTIDEKIKASLEHIIEDKLSPLQKTLTIIEKRVYELKGEKASN